MEPSSNNQSTIPVNLGSQQLPSTTKQSEQVEMLPWFPSTMPVNFGSQQLSTSEKHQGQTRGQASIPVNLGAYPLQSVQMQPPLHVQTHMPVYFGLHPLSSTNRRPSGIQPLHYIQTSISGNMGSHPSSSKNKRPAQMEASPKSQTAMPINVGLQQLLSTSKRPSQMEPPLKVQTESFESVRSKLRDSLASALGMVSEKQSKSQIVEKTSPGDDASRPKHSELGTQPGGLPSITTNASLCGTSETLTLNKQCQKDDEGQGLSCDLGSNENTSDTTKMWKSDVQGCQPEHVSLADKVPFSSNSTIKDELLQGHGLCWASDVDAESSEVMLNHDPKRPKLILEEVTGDTKGTALQNPENLATKIEAELFKLFGGVNKKYKEKGRSLLFNLKDRSNPELRERVLSGDIAPERLCSMTAEELASKELSEWRLAKAEELAQMVVLQDSEVDIRRLVRKTHKGEFQVEVEQDDIASVEVGLGADLLSQIPTKPNEEAQTQSKSTDKGRILSKPNETKAPDSLRSSDKAESGDQNLSSNVDTLVHEKSDLMQEFMVDELKDTALLPPIVSLDEFMEALDKEPPFENLPMDTEQDIPSSAENNSESLVPEMNPASDSLDAKSDSASDSLGSKLYSLQDSLISKLDPANTIQENPEDIATDDTNKVDDKYTRNDTNLKSGYVHVQSDTYLAEFSSKSENIWEGQVQFNISAPATVIGSFRSGERTSTQEWPSFLEIKGRVRVDAFEKFLQELPLSRSRAIMIAEFCWKEGSPETGRLHLIEAVNSYVADERVGFAEPAPGVELYLCPPHPKTTEILGRHLPKDHTEGLHLSANGLIGVIVWRRPHVTISPRLSKQHKQKKHFSSRKQQAIDPNPTTSRSSLMPPHPSSQPPTHPHPHPPPDDELIDDVPPGFGPRDDDDLPEFDFVHSRSQVSAAQPSRTSGVGETGPRGRPVEQMRELIQRYGQSGSGRKRTLEIQPWNDNDDDEDDDIPEWQPRQDNQPQMHPPPVQLPPPPPLPPQQLHGYQQQAMQQPFVMNQHLMLMQPQQQQLAAPLTMPLQHQFGLMMPGPPAVHTGWQPTPWWPPARGPADLVLPLNGGMQPCHFGGQPSGGGQIYGMPAPVQNGMGWRPDNPRGG